MGNALQLLGVGRTGGSGGGGSFPGDAYLTPDGTADYRTPDGSDYYATP